MITEYNLTIVTLTLLVFVVVQVRFLLYLVLWLVALLTFVPLSSFLLSVLSEVLLLKKTICLLID